MIVTFTLKRNIMPTRLRRIKKAITPENVKMFVRAYGDDSEIAFFNSRCSCILANFITEYTGIESESAFSVYGNFVSVMGVNNGWGDMFKLPEWASSLSFLTASVDLYQVLIESENHPEHIDDYNGPITVAHLRRSLLGNNSSEIKGRDILFDIFNASQ